MCVEDLSKVGDESGDVESGAVESGAVDVVLTRRAVEDHLVHLVSMKKIVFEEERACACK